MAAVQLLLHIQVDFLRNEVEQKYILRILSACDSLKLSPSRLGQSVDGSLCCLLLIVLFDSFTASHSGK